MASAMFTAGENSPAARWSDYLIIAGGYMELATSLNSNSEVAVGMGGASACAQFFTHVHSSAVACLMSLSSVTRCAIDL
jgi:hypothetical protein